MGDAARPRSGASPHPAEEAVPPDQPEGGVGFASLTPMMRQYQEWKRRYPDYLLLFRLGDFYEAFHEDAAVAARTLCAIRPARRGHDLAGMGRPCGRRGGGGRSLA